MNAREAKVASDMVNLANQAIASACKRADVAIKEATKNGEYHIDLNVHELSKTEVGGLISIMAINGYSFRNISESQIAFYWAEWKTQ